MNQQRIDLLANDLNAHVFAILDNEPEFTGDDAGRIAAEVEDKFRQEIFKWQMTATLNRRLAQLC